MGVDAAELLGTSIAAIVGDDNLALIQSALASESIEEANPLSMNVRAPVADIRVDAFLHRSGSEILLELEPVNVAGLWSARDFQRVVRGAAEAFAEVRTVQQLCEAAVGEIARITGFDRVMVYRFEYDWHGEVVAERHAPEMEPFFGLHYPASDIPQQAREVFRCNWLRSIPDVGYTAATIVPDQTVTGKALDLGRSVLRSVSPLHIEYLQNMGVAATLTISLLKNGELWGLIACHHRTPRPAPYQLRFACEMVGRTMSLNLGTLEESEDTAYRMKLKDSQMRSLNAMSKSSDVWSALAAAESDLLSLVGAEGAAICFGDDCRLVGQTPQRVEVLAIVEWLAANEPGEMFVSDSLPLIEPKFQRVAATACGIIALALSRTKRSYVLWFRPEILRTVNWGGDPRKSADVERTGQRLTPRKSFASWSESVRLHSRRWSTHEVDAAREWCRFVRAVIVDRADEIEHANHDLAVRNIELASLLRSNVELDSFAHIASHDLKEPLRGIHNFANLLIEDYGAAVGEDGREKLDTLVRLSRRMESLIDSLLALSSIGRVDLLGGSTDLGAVVNEVVELYLPRLAQCGGDVSIVTPLPLVHVDSARLGQVFNNLLSNALKYSERPPHVEIGIAPDKTPPPLDRTSAALQLPAELTTVYVRDNGIGIREKHLASIFGMFKRLHASEAYGGGTGAGLAIARKIVERHGGQMWAESTFGEATTFYFTLPTGA